MLVSLAVTRFRGSPFGALACTTPDLGLFIHRFTPHCLYLALKLDDPTQNTSYETNLTRIKDLLIRKVSIFDLKLLEAAIVIADCVAMLILPFLCDLLLLDHDTIRTLFIALVPLFRLEQCVLKVSNFDVALIIEFINTTMEHNLHAVEFGDGALLLISELVDELAEALIVVKVAFVVAHVRVKLDFLLMLKNSSRLPLVFD